MAGSEKEKKMELLHRAVGQVEGVAFFQSEVVRELLLGAVEDITDGVESMKKQLESMEAVGLMQTTQIERLMKDKDDLLTENAKLRESIEKLLNGRPAYKNPYNEETLKRIAGMRNFPWKLGLEIATTPAGSRNDETEVPDGRTFE